MRNFLLKLWLWGLPFFFLGCQTGATDAKEEAPPADRPNVILIMADDMGYADLSCYGSKTVHTPHIDRLAKEGMKLTDYHSNGAVCSPTRASLLTGLYPQEAGIEGVVTAKSHRDTGMAPEKYTLAELFKDAGYKTALFGKWHLGYKPEFGPAAQGFDDFRGFVSGNIDYQSHIDQEGFADWWEGKELKPEEGYLTDIITDHGIQFMEKVKDHPFFLYLPHGAPHYPYQGPDDSADRTVKGGFPIQGSRKDRDNAYKEMMASLDDNVGRIMAYLEENSLLENTLVIFCSDNGATKLGSNAPFRGNKGQLYEGGHRVPAIFYWKGKIQPGISDQLVMAMDIFPTLAGLLNIELEKKVSGQSAAAWLMNDTQNNTQEERTVFWRFKGQKAVRKGKWKLMVQDGQSALYDLENDKGETTDVKEEYPAIHDELMQAVEQWESHLKEEIKA